MKDKVSFPHETKELSRNPIESWAILVLLDKNLVTE